MMAGRGSKITKDQAAAAFTMYRTTPYTVRTVAIRLGLDVEALQKHATRHKWGAQKKAAKDRDISQVDREFSARRREVVNEARDRVMEITGQSLHMLREMAEAAVAAEDAKALREINQTFREAWQLACEVLDIRPDMRENRIELVHKYMPDWLQGEADD